MEITRGKLRQIIAEEIQKFVESTKESLLSEGVVTAQSLKKLLEDLEQENGN
jgi:uncharacterized HAD superfamily protein